MTPLEAARRYKRLQEGLKTWAQRTLTQWSVVVGSVATSRYMRDAKGEPRRRRRGDTGLLRIVSSRLARSLIGARHKGKQEGINRVRILSHLRIMLTKGSRVPYARVHEEGFTGARSDGVMMNIPARPYLRPAVVDSIPTLRKMGQVTLAEEVTKFLDDKV